MEARPVAGLLSSLAGGGHLSKVDWDEKPRGCGAGSGGYSADFRQYGR